VPSADEHPRFTFVNWYGFGAGDQGTIEVRVGQGAWAVVSQTNLWAGNGWSRGAIDLRPYAGQEIQVAFHFTATDAVRYDSDEGPGWYVDDVALVTGPPVLANDFEAGWGDWSVDGASWEVGVPTSGPKRANGGQNCAGTVLAGNYGRIVDTRLMSPPFFVPSADEHPRFTFVNWYGFGAGDQGTIEVRVGQGAWAVVSQTNLWEGNGWSRGAIDLRPYAGQEVRVAFHFTATDADRYDSDEGPGWYIDDVALVTGPPRLNNPEGFESGWGDWSAMGAIWEVGTPSTGPGKAHSGTVCAATVLSANYGSITDSRLVTPGLIVPAAVTNPSLRFWHWYSFGRGDEGTLEIRTLDGSWEKVAGPFQNASAAWVAGSVSLSPYSGQTVQLAFHFEATDADRYSSDEGPGWYIDDVSIRANVLPALEDKTINEGECLVIPITVPGTDLELSLCNGGPDGAAVDPLFGVLTWCPTECQGPGSYPITICVTSPNSALKPIDSRTFTVMVNEVNSPPIVAPIGTKPIQDGVPLAFTVTAFDPDCPTNALIFTLDSGAPEGATVDPRTGSFSWIPTAAQALTDHTITVRVTDDGIPPRSSTVSFLAIPKGGEAPNPPHLLATLIDAGKLMVTVEGMSPGVDYELETSMDLINWTTLTTLRSETGTTTFVDPEFQSQTMRFYRVKSR
jgi:hypothetical protein